jgi:hypothetical protein
MAGSAPAIFVGGRSADLPRRGRANDPSSSTSVAVTFTQRNK